MTHSPENQSATVIKFQSPEERNNAEFRVYQLEILDEVREMIERGEIYSLAVAVEKEDFGIYTNFTGGFNPVLQGAVQHLLWRLNEID